MAYLTLEQGRWCCHKLKYNKVVETAWIGGPPHISTNDTGLFDTFVLAATMVILKWKSPRYGRWVYIHESLL